MTIRLGAVGRIFFTRWTIRPTASDVRLAIDAILAARRKAGQPLVLIAILPPGMHVPDPEGRQILMRFIPIMEHVCDSQYAVLLGESLRSIVLRGSIGLFRSVLRQPVYGEKTIEAAVRGASARLRLDADAVLAEALERGLIDREDLHTDERGGKWVPEH